MIVKCQPILSTDPDVAAFIFRKEIDKIPWNGGGIIFLVKVTLQIIPVITVQAGARTDPDEAAPVVQHATDGRLRQSLVNRNLFKIIPFLRQNRRKRHTKKADQEKQDVPLVFRLHVGDTG